MSELINFQVDIQELIRSENDGMFDRRAVVLTPSVSLELNIAKDTVIVDELIAAGDEGMIDQRPEPVSPTTAYALPPNLLTS